VIIHEERNKQISKFLIPELPYPFKNSEQFNYLQNVAIGPEWNTLRSHNKIIKPKIITTAGQIIKPIKAPKQLQPTK